MAKREGREDRGPSLLQGAAVTYYLSNRHYLFTFTFLTLRKTIQRNVGLMYTASTAGLGNADTRILQSTTTWNLKHTFTQTCITIPLQLPFVSPSPHGFQSASHITQQPHTSYFSFIISVK